MEKWLIHCIVMITRIKEISIAYVILWLGEFKCLNKSHCNGWFIVKSNLCNTCNRHTDTTYNLGMVYVTGCMFPQGITLPSVTSHASVWHLLHHTHHDTGLWLVNTGHVTWILASDWSTSPLMSGSRWCMSRLNLHYHYTSHLLFPIITNSSHPESKKV